MTADPSAETGSVLVVVLAFVGTVGLLTITMLQPTLSSTKRSVVASGMVDRSVTVSSALQAAIADADRLPGACGTVDPPPLNDLTPTVTCSALGAGGAPLGAFVLVADEVQRGGSGPLKVVGSSLDRSGEWSAWAEPGASSAVEGGDLVGTDDTCEDAVPPSGLTVAAPGWVRCVDDPLVHEPTLPEPPQPPRPPAEEREAEGEPVYDPDHPHVVVCRIFQPGTYDEAPRTDVDTRFLPGTYTFDSIGDWTIEDDVIVDAGATPPTTPALRPSNCPAAAPAPGVVWQLTGNSTLEVSGPAALLVGGAIAAPGKDVSFEDPASTIRLAQLWAGRLTIGADLEIASLPAQSVHLEAALPHEPGVRCVAITADVDLVPDGPPLVRASTSNLPDGADPPVCTT